MSDSNVTVSLDDLALALYLPKPTVDYGEPTDRGYYPNATCVACGCSAGAHYCVPREAAKLRLERVVTKALDV